MTDTILVTGGAGYVGSHVILALREAGYRVVAIDSLISGDRALVPGNVPLIEADIRDIQVLGDVCFRYKPAAIIHCAGSLIVEESVSFPLAYYRNNVGGAWAIADVAKIYGVENVIFSSTASVYGATDIDLVNEDHPLLPANPYAASKAMGERSLLDVARLGGFNFTALRYFNVAGADPSGRTGQPQKAATHLITAAVEHALGYRPKLKVFGTDYPTRDGSAERDYIHVSDLAQAHVDLLRAMRGGLKVDALNVGYGKGTTVLEVLEAVRLATGRPLDGIEYAGRRPGDVPRLVADSSRLRQLTGWTPRFDNINLIVSTAAGWAEKRASVNIGSEAA